MDNEESEKSKIIRCEMCDEFIGIETENGIIIGNILLSYSCINCGCGRCKILHTEEGVVQRRIEIIK